MGVLPATSTQGTLFSFLRGLACPPQPGHPEATMGTGRRDPNTRPSPEALSAPQPRTSSEPRDNQAAGSSRRDRHRWPGCWLLCPHETETQGPQKTPAYRTSPQMSQPTVLCRVSGDTAVHTHRGACRPLRPCPEPPSPCVRPSTQLQPVPAVVPAWHLLPPVSP